jgi:two-component system, chemotaxis family, chemotaxis protein CheY
LALRKNRVETVEERRFSAAKWAHQFWGFSPRGDLSHLFGALPPCCNSKGGVMEQFAAVKRSKDNQPVRYLIVDDSVFARKNLARMIESFGGQVAAEAGDGLTAISEFERTHPDIVLMDITMPQMEGIEAAEKIVQAHPEARVVMVSSVGYQENIVAALQRGARHFVQKPVKPEVLYEVIKYVMGEDGAVAATAGAGA